MGFYTKEDSGQSAENALVEKKLPLKHFDEP